MRGTITKYKRDGVVKSWGYYFRQKNQGGSWKQNTKGGFSTKREAEKGLAGALAEAGLAEAKEPVATEPSPPPTFAEVLDSFLTSAAIDCSPATLEAYQKQSRYARRELGSKGIDQITTKQLQGFFTSLRTVGGDKGRPLSPKTIKHIRFLVKSVFDRAIKEKYLTASPLTKDIRTPKVPKKKFRMPDKQRLKQVIEKARGTRLYPILVILAATGIRLGELAALLWSDFNPQTGMLEISKSLEDTQHGIRVKSTKSGEPRFVSLPPSAIAALEEHRLSQAKDKTAFGRVYQDAGYIFCPPGGGHYVPSNLSTRLAVFLRSHGLGLTAHGLRHSHASILLHEGADIPAVSARLGHSDPSITLSIYSHVIPSDRGRLALMWEDGTKPQMVRMLGNAREKAAQSA